MTNEEQAWKDLCEEKILNLECSDGERLKKVEGFNTCLAFMEENLEKHPRVAKLISALEKYESAFKTIEAQVKIRPDIFRDGWERQMKTILCDARQVLKEFRGEK